MLIRQQARSGNPHRIGGDELAVGFNGLPNTEGDTVMLDCSFRQLVGFGGPGNIGLGEQDPVTSHYRAALPRPEVSWHPDHCSARQVIKGCKQNSIDSRERLVVSTTDGGAVVDRFHARLAVDEEGAPGFSVHGSLCQGPRFGAWDVLDPPWGDTRRRCDGDVVFVKHRESPPIPGQKGGGAIEAGAIGVDAAAEAPIRGVNVPVESGSFGREGTVWSREGCKAPSNARFPSADLAALCRMSSGAWADLSALRAGHA